MLPSNSATLLIYCRPGFESDAATELSQHLAARGYPKCQASPTKEGAYLFAEVGDASIDALRSIVSAQDLVFARQLIFVAGRLDSLPEADRIGPLAALIDPAGKTPLAEPLYSQLFIESPDTNEGKKLQKFCRKVMLPAENRLKKLGYKRVYSRRDCPQIHFFFEDYQRAAVGFSFSPGASTHDMGIIRLKFPHEAPSRSTLKLDEAFFHFSDTATCESELRAGLVAVDLGAAPGGWTYQLVRRGMQVIAVDNGPLDEALLASGQVTHLRQDAFGFVPPHPVDWLVCDVVEQPRRIAALLAKWLERHWCRAAIVNLKLPMKRRHEEVAQCLALIKKEGRLTATSQLAAKQLYHDRDEVTVYARL